jgi:integrase
VWAVPEEVPEALAALTNSNPQYVLWDGKSNQVQATNNLQGHFRRVFREAGIDNGHSHRFRDTAAAEWLKPKEVSLWQVSKLLGYTNTIRPRSITLHG